MKKLKDLLNESQHLDYRRMNVGEEKEKGMTNEEKRAFVEAVSAYRQFGEMISHKGNLSEIHESIKGIVENANKVTIKDLRYKPRFNITNGIENFVKWYLEYFKIKKKYEKN